MKMIMKIFGLITLVMVGGALLSIVSIPLLAVALFLIYYYTKKKPDERKRKYSIIGAIVTSFGAAFFVIAIATGETETTSTTQQYNTDTQTQRVMIYNK